MYRTFESSVMHLSLIAARSANNVIGRGPIIPWAARGEQLLFKALTFNQWVLTGRKTYETIEHLVNRRFVVLSGSPQKAPLRDNAVFFSSYEDAFSYLSGVTRHVMVAGGGGVFADLIGSADSIHLSTLELDIQGDVYFPDIPPDFREVYSQEFESNINWRYALFVADNGVGTSEVSIPL
ncbi:MAG: dihydrofolate reductase [Spirochaetota bacterium]